MPYLMPVIGGSVLLAFGFLASFMKVEISITVMTILVVGAILLSLRNIRKFQLTKEGFSIEQADLLARAKPN
jgi:hypothetical protein